ncbi:response regulator [Massilia sp. PAMC28688]|uniref:hybrid sensor histidine kinase/response regulator n=1 Tax=Massilia sp. PAMC28688 TaxID=2861283 RepID=UPI001C62E530|nr:hybrid sensor histidine kinase/response regulator [Massilia sp. PAMC28688]QYF92223.1 response regulator [Massilia sp. PAMC28688]
MKIRAYLALMVAAILIPVILFSTISLSMLLKSERDAALKGVRETARITLVSVDRELTNSESAVRILANSPYLESGDLEGFYRQAHFADKKGSTWTALLDESGQQLINTNVPYGTVLPPPDAASVRVRQVLDAGKPMVSNLIRGVVSKVLLVAVDVPVTTRSGKRYMISQGFRVDHFNRVLRQVSAPPGWLAAVFDRNGLTIARTKGGEMMERGDARPDLRQAIANQTEGVIRNASGSNKRLYTVLERSALSGWTVAVGVPEAEIEMAAQRALKVSMLGLLAAILCAAAAAVFFARRLSHSIALAARSAKALERDEPVGPPSVSGVAEVDQVQAAIAAAAVVVRNEKLSRQRAEDQREVLFELEHEARTLAEQQNRAKDEFLAMLGHELRNPLAAIVNATNVMAHKGMSEQATARARDIITRQSGHLTRIVDDLLDMGRLHSGKILLERRPLRMDLVVEAYMAALAGTARAQPYALALETAPAWVDADPTRLEQIIANLLDNALKYTPAGGSIHVSVAVDGAEAVLAVADSGVGIGPELMPYVFDLFVQGARALDRAQGGLGVGLALVRRLAVMHGGRVTVHSQGTGLGSRFELRLPVVDEPAESNDLPDAVPVSRQKVLLIEDNEDAREMMSMMLAAQDYEVSSAVDGYDGLRQAAENLPDVALVDIGLPGIDGYEVARRMRDSEATAGIRLVALTGYGQESDRARALAAGFDAHLVKPVDMNLLLAVLEEGSATPPGAVPEACPSDHSPAV